MKFILKNIVFVDPLGKVYFFNRKKVVYSSHLVIFSQTNNPFIGSDITLKVLGDKVRLYFGRKPKKEGS
jgi:hypothetical protein